MKEFLEIIGDGFKMILVVFSFFLYSVYTMSIFTELQNHDYLLSLESLVLSLLSYYSLVITYRWYKN